MPPHQKLDSYAGMAAQRSTTTQKDMGRGATAGWVKCPLCPPRRQKRYARGRGLTAHLEAVAWRTARATWARLLVFPLRS